MGLSCYVVLILIAIPLITNAISQAKKCPLSDHGCQCLENVFTCSELTTLPEQFGEDIRTVDLSGSSFSTLATIKDAEDLTFLSLSNCSILNIRYDAFDNLDNLNTLVLSHNNISRVTDDVFEWNPLQLKELRLDHNKLDFVQHFLLYDLEKLTILDLSYNNISFIHPHAFSQLKSLNELHLRGNQLHTFDPKWMKGLHSNMFKVFSVQENPWSCDCAMIPAKNWIKKTKWAQKLLGGLVCNTASKGNTPIFQLNNKTFVQCDAPIIHGISQSTQLKVHQSIQLDCQVDTKRFPVPSIVWVAPNTDRYSMHTADRFDGIEAFANGSIVIHDFKKEDVGMYNCTASNQKGSIVASTTITIGAEDNVKDPNNVAPGKNGTSKDTVTNKPVLDCVEQCTCISRHVDCSSDGFQFDIMPNLSSLEKDILTLSLANNNITEIKSHAFKPFKMLEEIRLDNNKISTISRNVFNLSQLSTLTMRDNRLHHIPKGLFGNLAKLTILVLDNNELTEINDDMFKNLKSLQWLYIRNNKISQISNNAFAGMEKIRFIHMEGNIIQTMSYATIKPLILPADVTVNKIFVDDNSFVCDCKMLQLQTFLKTKSQWKNLFGEGIICSFPIEYDKLNLISITDKLNCTKDPNVVFLTKTDSGSMSGLWFGGLALGVILTVAALFVWKKWRCRVGGPAVQYQNVPGIDDASEHASILSNKGGGSEAFV